MATGSSKPLDYIDRAAVSKFSSEKISSPFPMEGNVSGHHRSNHMGSSVEFAEYREYSPGEDPRRVDWRVLARTDRLFVKDFEAETNLRCQFGLDCSRSMQFGNEISKFHYAKKLIATLSYLFLCQGDAIGINHLGTKIKIDLEAKRSPSHLNSVLKVLKDSVAKGKQSLVSGMHQMSENTKMRSMLVFVSDFLEDPVEIIRAVHHCRERKHEVVLFQILDRHEIDFPFEGPTRFVDLEGGSSVLTDPESVRTEYLQQLENHMNYLRSGCRETNSHFYRLTTNASLTESLEPFLHNRSTYGSK
jgi:uncharacterized protein (DUF58 family)